MPGKAVISLTTGMEDPERVTVAFLVAVGAAETAPGPSRVRCAVSRRRSWDLTAAAARSAAISPP